VLGQGWTTGHQNRRPVPKKDACSNSCHQSDRSANSNTAGTCHPIKASAAASQQIAGLEIKRASHFTQSHRRIGATMLRVIHPGRP
jgi:hypothetical protein